MAGLVDGKVTDGPDLSVTHFSGLKLPNPFVIGSGERPWPPACMHCQP